jgi:hypothetical protein
MKTGTMKKHSKNLWINEYTKYRIEYNEGYNGCFCYVVFDNQNFVVWDFEDLETAKGCAKHHYIDSAVFDYVIYTNQGIFNIEYSFENKEYILYGFDNIIENSCFDVDELIQYIKDGYKIKKIEKTQFINL